MRGVRYPAAAGAFEGGDKGKGALTSAASMGTVFNRNTSGRGASAERRGRDEKAFGIGSTSARDDADELADEDE